MMESVRVEMWLPVIDAPPIRPAVVAVKRPVIS
jgi:hypothetical protein